MACKQNLVPLVIAEANRRGVDQAIALAVARRETGICHWWDNGQVKIGKAGEVGVMQVMPSTAPGVDLYDVQANVRAGVGFLADMYRQFGNWPLAIAAYNWGPGHVETALAQGKALPSSVLAYVREVTGRSVSTSVTAAQSSGYSAPGAGSPVASSAATWFAFAGAGVALYALLI